MNTKEFESHQERTFDAFCKVLIRNESAEAFRELKRRAEEEVSLSTVPYDELERLRIEDTYDTSEHIFDVRGLKVSIDDWALGQALQYLTPSRREVILLYYFLERSEPEISRLLDLTTGAIHKRHAKALQRLRELLEELNELQTDPL